MSGPYRVTDVFVDTPPGPEVKIRDYTPPDDFAIDPLTASEIEFWKATYLSRVAAKPNESGSDYATAADNAVMRLRRRIGMGQKTPLR